MNYQIQKPKHTHLQAAFLRALGENNFCQCSGIYYPTVRCDHSPCSLCWEKPASAIFVKMLHTEHPAIETFKIQRRVLKELVPVYLVS